MHTLLKNKYLPWSPNITEEIWNKIINRLHDDGYTPEENLNSFTGATVLTYAVNRARYQVYTREAVNYRDKPTTVAELLGEEEWLIDIRKRYPIGTRFCPAHNLADPHEYCIVTNDKFSKSVEGYITALTDESSWYAGPGKYGTTVLNRIVYFNGKYATIVPCEEVTTPITGNPVFGKPTEAISCPDDRPHVISSSNNGMAQLTAVSPQSYSTLDLINIVPNHFIHSYDTGIKVPPLKYAITYPEYIKPPHTKVSLDIDIDTPHTLTLSKKHKVSNIKLNIE